MGFGDDIMGTATAKAVVEHFRTVEGREVKCVFGNPDTYHNPVTNRLTVHFSEVFLHNPHIYQPGEPVNDVACVPDYPGQRAYIDYEASIQGRMVVHQDFRAPRGDLYFTEEEMSQAKELLLQAGAVRGLVFVEPNVKGVFSAKNKAWPFERWAQVCEEISPLVTVIQMVPVDPLQKPMVGVNILPGAVVINTGNFRTATALMAAAAQLNIQEGFSAVFAGTDGGLHHAAAALNMRSVVLWSGYTSPLQLGYADHINLASFDIEAPCRGIMDPDPVCEENMAQIQVPDVRAAIMDEWERSRDEVSPPEED